MQQVLNNLCLTKQKVGVSEEEIFNEGKKRMKYFEEKFGIDVM